jgi:hypothetical protein
LKINNYSLLLAIMTPKKIKELDLPLQGVPESIDVTGNEVDNFASVPIRAQQVAVLLSFGWTCPEIDKAFGLAYGTAAQIRCVHLKNKAPISKRTRDVALATMIRSKAAQVVAGITPEKINKAGLGELAKSAAILLQRAADLEGATQTPDHAAQISRALSALSSNNNSDGTESAQALEQ